MSEQLKNNAESTLASGIDNSQTTLTVASALLFPSSGTFRVRIENEILTVTSVSGTTFTVSRGSEGTTAISHASGKTVSLLLTVAGLDGYVNNFRMTGTLASLPAAGIAGRIYMPTDSWTWFYDNGSSWDGFGPQYYFKKPLVADYTWYNQGSNALASDRADGLHLRDYTALASQDHLRCLTKTRSSTSTGWKLTVAFSMMTNSTGIRHAGVGLFESSGNDVEAIRIIAADGVGPTKQGIRYSDAANGTPGGLSTNINVRYFGTAPMVHWIQIEQYSTYFQYRYSTNGIMWWDDFTRNISGSSFGGNPDKYFFYVAPYSGGVGIIVHHLEETG